MQIRFRHQAKQISDDQPVDNYVNPNELTQIELKTLKNTFSQINGVQKRLSGDFGGETL
jgi:signal-transduction protein with cAMP-binding, CBS, and nucleotidyltransferase domain